MRAPAKKAITSEKCNLPRDKNGKIIKRGGRTKGTPNKYTGEAKAAIAEVFAGLGGPAGMLKWAKASKVNRMAFYVHIYPKLIPIQIAGKMDVNVKSDAERAAVDTIKSALLGVIAAQRAAGSDRENPPIIDAVANADPVPQLVLSGKTRTKAA